MRTYALVHHSPSRTKIAPFWFDMKKPVDLLCPRLVAIIFSSWLAAAGDCHAHSISYQALPPRILRKGILRRLTSEI